MNEIKLPYWIILFQVICLLSCQTKQQEYQKIRGETMGTYYLVTFEDDKNNHDHAIDSILIKLNKELSTYDPESLISAFNASTNGITLDNEQLDLQSFRVNLNLSKKINQLSNGAFDPSLMPVINYWGFGYTGREAISQIDSVKIKSLLSQTGLQQVELDLDAKRITKAKKGLELDFSAIAKGHGVDLVTSYLDGKQVANYLVDIGGESRAKGVNSRGKGWILGINTPLQSASFAESSEYVQLKDVSMATSGNYRNYLETASGQTYGHTIDPSTGFPAKTDMLSASVIAEECITADAWATTFMAMGVKKSKQLVEELDGIEALFIFGSNNTELDIWQSSGFGQHIFDQ